LQHGQPTDRLPQTDQPTVANQPPSTAAPTAARGFHVCYIREELPVPCRFDVATGAITCAREPVHRFRISFETKGVRDDVAVGRLARALGACAWV
jgi:hypothetical protein